MVYTSYIDDINLERSPSLMSRSSGASTPPPQTPNLASSTSGAFDAQSQPKGSVTTPCPSSQQTPYDSSTSSSLKTSHLPRVQSSYSLQHTSAGYTPSNPPSALVDKVFGYQAKLLSRTSSVQSISNLHNLHSASDGTSTHSTTLPRGPGSLSARPLNDTRASTVLHDATSNAATTSSKRSTWTPGHRPSTSASIDDVVGRFGGSTTQINITTTHSTSSGRATPIASIDSTPTWRRNMLSRSGTASSISSSSHAGDENVATGPTWRSTRNAQRSAPTSPTTSTRMYGLHGNDSFSKPFSPTTLSASTTNQNFNTPTEGQITSSKSYSNHGAHRLDQNGIALGGVHGLSKTSVELPHSFKDYVEMRNDTDFPSSSQSTGRSDKHIIRNDSYRGQAHRRTKTLPEKDMQATLLSEPVRSYRNTPDRPFSPEILDVTGPSARPPRTRMGLHGLDRVSERSDNSTTDDLTASPLPSPRDGTQQNQSYTNLEVERIPSRQLTQHTTTREPRVVHARPKSSAGRYTSTYANTPDETAALIIHGISDGGASVTGMSGRRRLTRADTVSGAHGSGYTAYGYGAAKAMETQRRNMQAYEYLCHVSEAQEWLVDCLFRPEADDPTNSPQVGTSFHSPSFHAPASSQKHDASGLATKSVVELEEALRDGVALAKLARVFLGRRAVPRVIENIRHKMYATDNINVFFGFTRHVGLPEIFCFETTDLYDAKNLPKVIYCIHALSHLLARQGLAQRIGDHLNKISFTDEELEKKQKGLDAAGVSMPSFGNIGRQLAYEIQGEPAETDEANRARLALEEEAYQAHLKEEEEARRQQLLQQQEEARQKRLQEERLRQEVERQSDLQTARPYVLALQSEARRCLARRAFDEKQNRLQRSTRSYIAFQAQCRGKLSHQRLAQSLIERQQNLETANRFVVRLQARIRGTHLRRAFYSDIARLDQHDAEMVGLQAKGRGKLIRHRYYSLLDDLARCTETTVGLQSQIRGFLARRSLLNCVRRLREVETQTAVAGLQSFARRTLARRAQEKITRQMTRIEVVRSVGTMQAFARGLLTRKHKQQQSKALGFAMPDVVCVQAQIRGFLARRDFWTWHEHLHHSQSEASLLQALLLGATCRRRFWGRLLHYHEQVHKVVKVQALFRRKQQLESYRQLTKGTNVPLMTIKNFIHLLSDNENDYREEVEVEHLKKTVITKIRGNQQLEADVADLDIRIALLVRNKMSLDDVERARRLGNTDTLGHRQRNSVLAAARDPFALASLDKATLRKLELYQQMFYLLQTKPDYLARLFFRMSRIEMGDRQRKAVEGVVLTLFGYAQNSREEFLLLKLFQRSIHEEVMSISSLSEFDKGDFVFIKLVLQYGRGAKERKYLQDLLAPLINDIVQDASLDLETDPLAIYRGCIAREEMETGLASRRQFEVTHQQALEDPEARTIFIRHLKLLRAKTDAFLEAIFSTTHKMPFGMRYIAREIFRALEVKFGQDKQDVLIRQVGHFLYYRYINPAVVAPESFDVVNATIGAAQRKNLAAIAKMLNQVSVARHFADENPYLSPLNEYVNYGAHRFKGWFYAVLDVPDAETQFNADEYLDHSLPHKPIIYISPNEIYSMHELVLQHLDIIAESPYDPLRVLLGELGGAPLPASAELDNARAGEIAMTLKGRVEPLDDVQAGEKALFANTKRYVLYLLKVQPAENLMQALVEPVSQYHEEAWALVVDEELRQLQQRGTVSGSPNPNFEDVFQITFREVKARCLENMMKLEALNRVKRESNFQEVLNALAQDIRNKHRKRIVRQREIHTMEGTIANLDDKHRYLEQQIDAFRSFVDSTKTTIQKKGKKRLVIPFSAQYFHRRELEKSGKLPKFGSYKYTARNLSDRGILLAVEGQSPRQYDSISLTISSDEVGVFIVEAFAHGIPVPDGQVELSMDELLQAQFNGKQTIKLGGMAKCNLNLLLSFINKKFYA